MRTKKEMKIEILRLLDQKCKDLYKRFLTAKAEAAAQKAGAEQWERQHPEDAVGAFSFNPYPNAASAQVGAMNAEHEYKQWQEVCDYALESLVE